MKNWFMEENFKLRRGHKLHASVGNNMPAALKRDLEDFEVKL